MIKEIEKKFDEVDKKIDKIKKDIENLSKFVFGNVRNVKCTHCEYEWQSKSKAKFVSCPSCNQKTSINLKSIEPEGDEIEDSFKGKRYEDYDDKFMKDVLFKGKKKLKCFHCPKRLTYDQAYYGFNILLCKECYRNLDLSNQKEVSKMVKDI